jgi:alpha-glucosidase
MACGLALLASATWASAAAPTYYTVASPNGKISILVSTRGTLTYRVLVNDVPLLKESRLGLRLNDGELGQDVNLVNSAHRVNDSTWTNPFGKQREVRDHYRELTLTLREKSSAREFRVVFRVFDDGVGFRYELPALPANRNQEFVVEEELTQFAFTADNLVYAGDHVAIPPEDYDSRGGFAGSQEWEFRRQRLSDLSPDTVTGLPLVTQTPVGWVALTEADLLDWAGLWLARVPTSDGSAAVTLRARLAPRLDGQGVVKSRLPRSSPWRVLLIGEQPGRLVESNLVLNLSTPSQLADSSWIKPGLMAWDRWWSGVGKADAATIKEFIQFASDMGWPYQLIDAGWYTGRRSKDLDITKPVPVVELPELRSFAAERNVKLWLWLYWTDVEQSDYEKAFATYEEWGIAGVKIDFMDRDDQEMVQWYEKIARAAAKHHLMVNFHGAYKPAGLQRTWPNQMTSEGVLGNEYNKWSTRANAEHRTTLPFTRYLAGPADFTPGGFVNRAPAVFKTGVSPTQVQSTRAGELALFVCYDSPVTCVCDHPSNYRDKAGIGFLKLVPTVWDETRVLSGAIGEHVVMARRSGDDWFLGALNNNQRRVKTLKLDFLGPGRWRMQLWRDHPRSSEEAELVETEEREVSATDTLDLKMQRSGGAVARFTRIP